WGSRTSTTSWLIWTGRWEVEDDRDRRSRSPGSPADHPAGGVGGTRWRLRQPTSLLQLRRHLPAAHRPEAVSGQSQLRRGTWDAVLSLSGGSSGGARHRRLLP